jgi:hypothetical protein
MVLFIDLFIWTRKKHTLGQQTLNWCSTVNDESAKSNDTYNVLSHIGAGVRYNFNPKFGLG